MKKFFLPLMLGLASAMLLTSCGGGNSNRFAIDGTCSKEIPDSAYYIFVSDANLNFADPMLPIDTIHVDDSKKFSWETTAYPEPRLIYLQAIHSGTQQQGNYISFVLCPGETAKPNVCNGSFKMDGSKFYHEWGELQDTLSTLSQLGQELQAKLMDINSKIEIDPDAKLPKDSILFNQFKDLQNQMGKISADYNALPKSYMASHPDADGDVAFLCMAGYPIKDSISVKSERVINGRMKSMVDIVVENQELQAKARAEKKAKEAAAKEATMEGKMFADFECEYNGQIQKLSDYVGKGKYILVDFWASWCGPCRREIPYIINVYNKYKGPKFDVVGVASWDKPEDTKQAIEEDKIPYCQIMNAQHIGTEAYGINGIPTIFLFGPDGTILKRDLRGEKIEQAVREALGK